jgi:hypothetical protein
MTLPPLIPDGKKCLEYYIHRDTMVTRMTLKRKSPDFVGALKNFSGVKV